jgi:hypothetical protein
MKARTEKKLIVRCREANQPNSEPIDAEAERVEVKWLRCRTVYVKTTARRRFVSPASPSDPRESEQAPRHTVAPLVMAQPFPYTYYSCNCSDSNSANAAAKRASAQLQPDDDEEPTFDPRNPRSNYSLYPLEHLLYCQDCQEVRCPRCVTDEVLNWFCPSCLFEVPSSVVKSDGNRYASILQTTAVDSNALLTR